MACPEVPQVWESAQLAPHTSDTAPLTRAQRWHGLDYGLIAHK